MWKEEKSSTTLMPSAGNTLIPINSHYTDYYVKIKVGCSETPYFIELEIEESLYHCIKSNKMQTLRIEITSYIQKRKKLLVDYDVEILED